MKPYFNSLRCEIRNLVGSRPWLYRPLIQWGMIRGRTQLANRHTPIVIEGFPRSGNSFACAAFQHANPEITDVATHLHVPAHVLLAVRWQLPIIVLLRRPDDAVRSWRALGFEVMEREGASNPRSLRDGLRAYTAFYRALRHARDRIVVADFDTVCQDYGRVIVAVNQRFGCRFRPFVHTDENVARVRQASGYHALPNELRDSIKTQVAKEFEQQREELGPIIAWANAEYDFFREAAV